MRKNALLALSAFVVCMVVMMAIVLFIAKYQRSNIRESFDRDAARIAAQTDTRLHAHFETLLSIKGLFSAGGDIDRGQFRRFLEQLQLKKNHPGFQAIQFVRYVPEQGLEQFVQTVRRDTSANPRGYPGFNIKPDVSAPAHYVVEYTEPMEGNETAFGLDLAALPSHLKALELGRDTGNPVATERVRLVQDPSGQPAFVIRMPIYKTGVQLDTVEHRREALIGFAATVYRVNDLMKEVVDGYLVPHMRIQITDTGYLGEAAAGKAQPSLMFDSKEAYKGSVGSEVDIPGLEMERDLAVGQRNWHLRFTAQEGTRYGQDYLPIASVLVSGTIISALIAMLVVGFSRMRELSGRLSRALGEQQIIVDNATVGIELLKGRTIQRCNQGMAEMLGYSRSELTGVETRVKYLSDAAYEAIGEAAHQTMKEGRSWIGDVEWVRKDGKRIWCRLHGKYVDYLQPEKGSIWVSYDITAEKLADIALKSANNELERSLSQVEQTYREVSNLSELSSYLQACPSIDDAFSCVCDFAPQLFPGSAGAIYLLDSSGVELVRRASWGESRFADSSFLISDCWALRRGQPYRVESPQQSLCCPHLRKDEERPAGAYVCLPLAAQANTLGLLYIEHYQTDAEANIDMRFRLASALAENIGLTLANIQLRETLRQESIRDPLTGLFNRRHMNEVLLRELSRVDRGGSLLALAVVDVDHFKRINDTYGHDTGDVVLKAVAGSIDDHVRHSDIVCRFGGEEFVVILPDIQAEHVAERAEEIRMAIARLDVRQGDRALGRITASVGWALYPTHAKDAATLLKAADEALYLAKEGGRDRVVGFAQQPSVLVGVTTAA